MENCNLSVCCESEMFYNEALELAQRLCLSVVETKVVVDKLNVCFSEKGVYLSDGKMELHPDFSDSLRRLKQNNLQNELLVKAVKIKGIGRPLNIIDATAGLGEDSLIFAAAGNKVIMFEYNPVIFALLSSAMKSAEKEEELSPVVKSMQVKCENSIEAMPQLKENADVVFLDPMFPGRSKSALIKKKFQLLQQLESPCSDEKELFEAAEKCLPLKIVVKRPLKGPFLANRRPSYSLSGKSVRYDCYINIREMK